MAKQYHILIVEDKERWREDIFREVLEDAGYQVQTSSNYAEAVAAVERQVFDLAVIDVNLTGVPGNQDGVRVLERIVSLEHRTLAIFVSGSKIWATAEKSAQKFHPIAFFDKTKFDVTEFVTLVTNALTSPKEE